MIITIKSATIADIVEINKILRLSKAYWGYDNKFLDTFMKAFSITEEYVQTNPTKLCYIDSVLAGFYSFIIKPDLELDNFFLHPDYIRKNLGRMLWWCCCNTAKELGWPEFILCSEPHADGFYFKMGCKKTAVKPSPLNASQKVSIMKYQIPSQALDEV